jgi:hypothetical protein
VRYEAFRAEATRVWEEIPDEYRYGVDGLVIEREARSHPSLDEIYTLGECLTESYPSEWGGPDTTRSVLVLYHGSFRELAALDPEFDWDYEIWETITHELRHHLESLAAEDALEDLDYAMDENFKRLQGEAFDPFFFRTAEPVTAGVWAAERDVFIEVVYPEAAPPGATVGFQWEGRGYTVERPPELGEVTFLQVVEGLPDDPSVCVVLVRKSGWWGQLRRWLRSEPPTVVDVDVSARAD